MEEVLFFERQRFKQFWLWLIIFGVDILFVAIAVQQIVFGKPVGDKPMTNTESIIAVLGVFAMTALFLATNLVTMIKKDGIYVRFFPFHWSFKKYSWGRISEFNVRKYNPILEYGGWGWRYGFKGKAYNISGNKGIQLIFNNGSKLLIGTNKSDEVVKTLQLLNPKFELH